MYICVLSLPPVPHTAPLRILVGAVGKARKKANFQQRAEDFRAAALIYRLVATKLEHKIRHFRSMDEGSKERASALYEWKDFFAEITKDIKSAHVEACEPPLEKQVREWIKSNIIAPNEVDQPSCPPRELTENEKFEATCLVTLDRAGAQKERRVSLLSKSEEGEV